MGDSQPMEIVLIIKKLSSIYNSQKRVVTNNFFHPVLLKFYFLICYLLLQTAVLLLRIDEIVSGTKKQAGYDPMKAEPEAPAGPAPPGM